MNAALRFSVLNYLLLFMMLLKICTSTAQSTHRIDSLLLVLETMKEDTFKANLLSEITKSYMVELNNLEKVAEYSNKVFVLSKKINFKRGIAVGIFYKGFFYWSKGNYVPALYHYKQALKIMEEIGSTRAVSYCYLNIGQTYSDMGNTEEALNYMLKGLKIKEQLNDKIGLEIGYNNIGNIFMTQGNYTKALTYYLKTLKIAEVENHKLVISYAYINVGTVFYSQNKMGEALVYFKKAAVIQEELGDKSGAGSSYSSIGNIYWQKKQFADALSYHLKDFKIKDALEDRQGAALASHCVGTDYFGLKNYKQALFYQLKSLKLSEEIGFKRGFVNAAGGLGNLYEEEKKYEQALKYYDQMLHVAKQQDYKEGVRDAYSNHASVYRKLHQFEKALQYTALFHEAKDTLLNKDNFKQVAELNTRYETDKKEKEILLLTKDQQLNAKTIKQQQLVRWGLIGGLGLLFISAASIYRRYRFKQKANLILERQKQEIEQKNVLITDSIDYAKTIQEAVLPDIPEVKQFFPESFILYKPKAIVSGDFYWLNSLQNQLICAVADCTGHGVPGAFMSLLGYNMLENVIKRTPATNPAFVLDELNTEVINRLSHEHKKESVAHGMDISLIFIDKTTGQLQYSGAHNPLYIVRNTELIELKADKMGIGFTKDGKKNYTNHFFQLMKGDMVYLFTDGFPDQIGGPNRKKFFYPPFKELLVSISPLSPEIQRNKLDECHVKWLDERYEQTDDILIMGIRY